MSKPSGQVYLCKNAIVDRNYGHTIDFKSPSEQLTYWGSLLKFSVEKERYTYIRRQRQELVVPYKLDDIQDVNYLYFRASEDSKYYFCFVDDKQYVSDTASRIYFTTDVLQTYMFDYKVNESYVVQEHCDRWDANHKPIYSRTEENLDYGSEYTIEAGYKVKVNLLYGHQNHPRWFVAICKPHPEQVKAGLNTTETDAVGLVSPYIYYLLPAYSGSSASSKYFKAITEDEKEITVGGLKTFLDYMSTSEMGNFVVQIVKLPYLPIKYAFTSDSVYNFAEAKVGGAVYISSTQLGDDQNYLRIRGAGRIFTKLLAEMGVFEGIESALPSAEQWAKVKADPYNVKRDRRFESKLLTHPYRYNLLTDWKTSPIVVKNEYIGGDKIKLNYTQAISFNSPARYWIENYKKDPEGRGSSLNQLVPEEAPVINDAYYSYMLENKNQIQANQTNAIVNSVTSVGQSLVGGAIFGGGAGAISGAVSGAVSGAINYQNMIRSENAKQRDLKNLPDTIVNSNDCNFNYFDDNEGVSFYRYKICCEFEELLADTFAMTGYTVKRVKVPNLKTRLRFNYVKTIGANIVGSFDQNDLALIRSIFDNGITFWHYNKDHFKMYDYSLENIEVNLV